MWCQGETEMGTDPAAYGIAVPVGSAQEAPGASSAEIPTACF